MKYINLGFFSQRPYQGSEVCNKVVNTQLCFYVMLEIMKYFTGFFCLWLNSYLWINNRIMPLANI